MRRNSGSGKLGLVSAANEEDINPLDNVANLVDVMLVFACGLMLSLIAFWNVDVGSFGSGDGVKVDPGTEITSMQSFGEDGQPLEDGRPLEEYGRVYRDAEGNLYMVVDGG